jgi:Holliday junction resolvase RusA-like endonuclease
MISINTFIGGDPKGQPRPRAFARKMGSKHVARMYDSDVADRWKRAVDDGIRQLVLSERISTPTDAPISIMIAFFFARPKSHTGAKGLKPSAPRKHTQKPDIDNLIKLVADRITRNGRIWRDDAQIEIVTAMKFWSESEREAGCTITISWEG